ncbi:adenosine deaminase [Pendulispora rubella]|uniref:adenosine deaminase n=1 Tax=Pendulispora rubella TaxID=2741070 RepID=A0ABZ2KWN4_9BACT
MKPTSLSVEAVRRVPKVLLHDHLDGGLRPSTIIELAANVNYDALPHTDPEALRQWFIGEANSHALLRYLSTFAHTTAVMQTPEGLSRVAAEAVADFDADGVVYAETRFAPEQHLQAGLTLDETVDAVLAGLREGERQAQGRVRVGLLLCAMRHSARALEIAQLTVRHRDRGVVGFDIAGAEVGYPPLAHLDAFEFLQHENMPTTVHAGEWLGPRPFEQALHRCGAWRIGHGISIAAEIDEASGSPRMSHLAAYVRDRRVPLEICPTSNLQTGGAYSYATHPFGRLDRLGFCVTINTDNRLMSDTTASQEFLHLAEAFGYELPDLLRFTCNAIDGAFLPYPDREQLKDAALHAFDRVGSIS